MKEIIFIKTHRGGRTNICAWFKLWDKETFLNDVKNPSKRDYGNLYRYGRVGETVKALKEMTLEEFNKEFEPETFSSEEITKLFRKEISLVYGEHKKKDLIKPLGKKDLIPGNIYLDFNNREVLYLGQINQIRTITDYGVKTEINTAGYGFLDFYSWVKENWSSDGVRRISESIDILKGIKKLKEQSGTLSCSLSKNYSWSSNGDKYAYRRADVKVETELLDIKE